MVAYVLFTTAGALLWKRYRSVATALVAIGFASVLVDQIISVVEYLEVTALLHGNPTDTFFIVQHRAAEQYIALVCLVIAAAGLLWHSLASPNNRWRGP
jgi:hypothetical protein